MRTVTQIVLLVLVASLAIGDDPQKDTSNDKPTSKEAVKVARSEDKRGNRVDPAKPVEYRASMGFNSNPRKPRITLSEAHKKTCLKQVGQTIESVSVTDMHGKEHQLKELLSDKLTVLVFWNDRSFPGAEQFMRIPVDVLATFARHRVKVIAANVGGERDKTLKLTGDGADKIVSLVDADRTLFKQFATSHLPRTYVLDKDGKILWFDLEYSQSTRRELANALSYYLKAREP